MSARRSYCANCDQVEGYKLDEAKGWECRACGFAIECVECGLQMSAGHDCVRGAIGAIKVNRTKVYPSVARRGPAWKWVYDCTGPDGRRWDGDSIVDLRDRLRRAYPGVEIVEPWKCRHACDNPVHCSTCLNEAAAKSTARRIARKAARR